MFGLLKIVAGSTLSISAFAADKQVELPIANKNDPVAITVVTMRGAKVQDGRFIRPDAIDPVTPFQAGNDWIQNLTIQLINRTDKTIVFANVSIGFPEIGDGMSRPMRICNLNLGRIPQPAAFDKNGNLLPQPPGVQPLSFEPGETLSVALSDYKDKIRSSIESLGVPLTSVTKLKVMLSSFYFDNGMKWAAGGYSVPDARIRGNWQHTGPDHFPGDREAIWPGKPGWFRH